MMELFTLGADRGAYTEHDVREQARALTGWRQRLERQPRPGQLPLRQEAARHGHEEDLRQARPLRLEGLVPPLRPPSQAPVVLRHQALELLHPDGAACRDAGRRSSASTSTTTTQVRPVVEAILRHPAALQRAADGEVAGRLPRRAAPRDAARDRHRVVDVAARASPASSSSTRRTSPAGTTRAGSTPPRSARAG